MILEEKNTLIVLYEDLISFDPQISYMLKDDPDSLISDAIEAFKNVSKLQSGSLKDQKYFVRFTTKDEKSSLKISLKALNSNFLSKLIICEGIVVKINEPVMRLEVGTYECVLCGAKICFPQFSPAIRSPRFCINKRCKARRNTDFRLIEKSSTYYDYQIITIQDDEHDKPRKLDGVLSYDLVNCVHNGDNVQLTGIYKTDYYYLPKGKRHNVFHGAIDINFIQILKKSEKGKFDVDMILMGQPRSKTNKLTRVYDRLKDLFEQNNWKALEKTSIIQIIELEENVEKSFIKNAIEEAIKEGTLFEEKPNLIKFTSKSV